MNIRRWMHIIFAIVAMTPHQSSCVTDENVKATEALGNQALQKFSEQLAGADKRLNLKRTVDSIILINLQKAVHAMDEDRGRKIAVLINQLEQIRKIQTPPLSQEETSFLRSGLKTKYRYLTAPTGSNLHALLSGDLPLYDGSQIAPAPSVPRPARTAAPVQPPRQRTETSAIEPKKPSSSVFGRLRKWWKEKREAKSEPVARPPAQDQNRWNNAVTSLASAFKKPLPKPPAVREFKRKTTEKRSSDQASDVFNPLVTALESKKSLALQQAATGTGLDSSGQSTPELSELGTPTTLRSRADSDASDGSRSTTSITRELQASNGPTEAEVQEMIAEEEATLPRPSTPSTTPAADSASETGSSSPLPPASPTASVHSASSATGSGPQAPDSPRTPVPQPPRAPIPTPAGATTPASGASQQPPAPPVPPVRGRDAQTQAAHPTPGQSTSEPQDKGRAVTEANRIGFEANSATRKKARSNAKLRFLTWRSAETLQNHSSALESEANTLQGEINDLNQLAGTVSTSALQKQLTEKQNKLLKNKGQIDAKLKPKTRPTPTTGSATTSTDPSDNDASWLYNWARRARLTKAVAFPELETRAQARKNVLKKLKETNDNPLRQQELEEEIRIIDSEIEARKNARLKALKASVPTLPEPPKIPAPKETNSAQSPEDDAKRTATRKQVPQPNTQVKTPARLPAQKPLQREDSSTTASPLSNARPLQRPASKQQPRPAIPTYKLEEFTPPPLSRALLLYKSPSNPKGRSQKNPLQELEELKKRGPARIKR